jgi:hypothetical protein
MSRYALLVVGLLVGCSDLRSPSVDETPRPRPAKAARAERIAAADPAPAPAGPTADPAAAAAAQAPATAPDLSLGDGFELRTAVRDGRLALLPIVATGAVAKTEYVTLPEGMARGQVWVREMPDEWDVGSVQVHNGTQRPLLGLQGEIILDAQQDRVLAETVVIPPGTTQEVSVRCVESGRSEGSTRFRTSSVIAELSLRRVIAQKDQSAVWAEVDRINERHGLSPETHTYRHAAALLTRGELAARRDRLAALLDTHPDRARMVGVAVAVDGVVLAVDRFASPALYRRLEPRLLASYAASSEGQPREGRRLTPDDIRALTQRPGALETTTASAIALRPPE